MVLRRIGVVVVAVAAVAVAMRMACGTDAEEVHDDAGSSYYFAGVAELRQSLNAAGAY